MSSDTRKIKLARRVGVKLWLCPLCIKEKSNECVVCGGVGNVVASSYYEARQMITHRIKQFVKSKEELTLVSDGKTA